MSYRGYESPVDILVSNITTDLENDILQIVQKYHIKVDREELIKALDYDRHQYDNGYHNGYADGYLEGFKEAKRLLEEKYKELDSDGL